MPGTVVRRLSTVRYTLDEEEKGAEEDDDMFGAAAAARAQQQQVRPSARAGGGGSVEKSAPATMARALVRTLSVHRVGAGTWAASPRASS